MKVCYTHCELFFVLCRMDRLNVPCKGYTNAAAPTFVYQYVDSRSLVESDGTAAGTASRVARRVGNEGK